MQLRELLAQPQHLPTIPAAVQGLIDSFADDDVAMGDIARLISADPGLAAKLLRLANSAYFRAARPIGSVDDALKMLGIKMTRNLVVGGGIRGAFKGAPGLDIRPFWRHSFATACVARWLATPARQDGELAFMVGLLHGIGQFPMRAGIAQEMKRIDRNVDAFAAGRADAERAALGFDHAEVGAELARHWRFPGAIVEGIRFVPRPLDAKPESPVAAVVHLAAWRVRIQTYDASLESVEESYPAPIARSLRIDKGWTPALLAKGEKTSVAPMPDLAELTAGMEEMSS